MNCPFWGPALPHLMLGRPPLKQAQTRIRCAFEFVVVHDETADATILGEGSGLGLDFLGGEDAGDGSKYRISIQQFQIAR